MISNDIIGAPSKSDLMIAFFNMPRRPVNFTVRDRSQDWDSEGVRQIEVVINSLSWESGGGESWCFEGYKVGDYATVKGWFKTTTRTGWAEITTMDEQVQKAMAATT